MYPMQMLFQAKPARRGSGQVSLKDIDKLGVVAKQLKELKQQSSPDTRIERTIAELEKAVDKARSRASENDIKDGKDEK
jgi:hypothetical protein